MCPVEIAVRCDAICQLKNIAAQPGRVIQSDPQREVIVVDAQASKMLTRPCRNKWRMW